MAPGFRFRRRNQLAHATVRRSGMQQQHVRRRRDEGDRREISARVVSRGSGEQGIDHHDARAAQQDRVAVGLRPCDGLGADRAAGTRAIIDDDRLSQQLSHFLSDEAGREIGDAARRERHHHAQRANRERMLRGMRGAENCEQGQSEPSVHQGKLHGRHLILNGGSKQYATSETQQKDMT